MKKALLAAILALALPAVAAEPVEEAGFFKRMWHSIKLLF